VKNTKYTPSHNATIRAADQAQPFAILDFIERGLRAQYYGITVTQAYFLVSAG
jgi:hypothetical protein